jgi:hypothetical protein
VLCFGSADSKEVTGVFFVSAYSKGDSVGGAENEGIGTAPRPQPSG